MSSLTSSFGPSGPGAAGRSGAGSPSGRDRAAQVWVFREPSGWERTRDPASGLWGQLYEEQAVVHGPRSSGFYLRGHLEIPVPEAADDLLLVVWVSVGGDDFERAHARWNDPRRVDEPAYFGRLCNRIPGYPDTWHLDVYVHTQPPGHRPLVEVQPSGHPLAADQKTGVSVARAVQIARALDAATDQR